MKLSQYNILIMNCVVSSRLSLDRVVLILDKDISFILSVYIYIYGVREHLAIYKWPETIQTLVIVSHTHLFLFLGRSLSDFSYDTKYCGKPHEPFSKQMAANHTL